MAATGVDNESVATSLLSVAVDCVASRGMFELVSQIRFGPDFVRFLGHTSSGASSPLSPTIDWVPPSIRRAREREDDDNDEASGPGALCRKTSFGTLDNEEELSMF